MIIVFILFILNILLGAIVMVFLDDPKEKLYKWYSDSPNAIVSVLVLNLWPFWLFIYLTRRRGSKK